MCVITNNFQRKCIFTMKHKRLERGKTEREREKKRERIANRGQIVMKLSNIIRGDPRFIYWSSLSRNIELIAYFAMIESIGIPDSGYAEAALMVVLTRERLWDIYRKYFRP